MAIRGYQPIVPGKKTDITEGNQVCEETTDGPEEEGEGEKEREDEGKEEEEKEASRRAEEACLEGLSDEIQDMLVVCGMGSCMNRPVIQAGLVLCRLCRKHFNALLLH